MAIILVGLNHRTAPVELREQLSLSGCGLGMALEELQVYQPLDQDNASEAGLQEAVILSTCNRLEIYAETTNIEYGRPLIQRFLGQLQNIPPDVLLPHLYFLENEAAIHHLMRVAGGLDSMILGEPQILGQVAQAFNDAQAGGMTGPVLSHLFARAVHAGKRARTETDISRYTTSVSHAAALLALERMGRLADRHVLIVGAGEMAVLAAQAMQRNNVSEITFINRTYSRAEALVKKMGGRAMNWHQLKEALAWADIVVSATSAPHTVIYATDVQSSLAQREGRPLLLIDIAVPRDIEESVQDLPGVQRYDIDDLRSIVDTNLSQREAAIPLVEAIIRQETDFFLEWLNSRQVIPVITNLQRWAKTIAENEVEQALNRLNAHDPHTEQVINRLANRLVSKLLHEPTMRLKLHAAEGNGNGYAYAMRELFGLNELEQIECNHQSPTCEPPTSDGTPSICTLKCIIQPGESFV
ncbi:MAG: glutamyl-tRNA reductase [Chloroflexi bacterium]|nr:glutamyl-tRNA reductase [Chloroflexota bacterium]